MLYLDSKIIGFINFFYDEVKKNKMPWVVKIILFDPSIFGGLKIEVLRGDLDLSYSKYYGREQVTLPKSSPDCLAKIAFEEIRKELDRWSSESH